MRGTGASLPGRCPRRRWPRRPHRPSRLQRARGRGSARVPDSPQQPRPARPAQHNLFVGHPGHMVSERELRRACGKFGVVEEGDGTTPARGQGAARAFLFRSLDMAHRAQAAAAGRGIGRSPEESGHGRASPTTRLRVGGLGPGTSLAALAREFDRFGIIRSIDHVKGDNFAYIQYESLDAARVACAKMRGFPLGGPRRRLRVDFAKAEETRYPPRYPPAPLPVDYELLADGCTRRPALDADLRAQDKTHPYLHLERDRTFLEGDWTGPRKGADCRPSLGGPGGSVRSRSGERWAGDRARGLSKPWEDRPEDSRGRTAPCAYKEGSWTQGFGQQYDCEGSHAGAGATESGSASLSGGRGAAEWGHHLHREAPESFYRKKTRERECSYGTPEAEPQPQEESKQEPKKLKTLSEYAQTLQLGWQGLLVLKNSCFPISLYVLEGDQGVISGLLRDQTSGSRLTQLRMTQRLRLDQPKFDEVTRRIGRGRARGYAVLLATQSVSSGPGTEGMPAVEPGLQRRLLRNLVSYLKGKQAAGVISLPVGGPKGRPCEGMLYAFPPCHFSEQYLQSALQTLGKLEEEHMLVVIVTGSA
ncbi:PREDICTED: putative RNA-binding protein 15B [Chinchilla lanigera]|uniref:putative RNA-binding protein 15B n=1 Tax=Chinchilla lanigera TaxID=34839 RepID=UPI00069796FB|nr:PREDICTED: putative RNA-binding protein 15B [Chinchilla lanigera]